MKISLLVILICWLCIVSLCFSQIGSKAQAKIYGIWHNNDFGYQMTLRLNTDGTGEFDGESVQFKTQGNSLIITAAGASTSYTYNLTGNSLSLSGGDLDQAIITAKKPDRCMVGLQRENGI
jgi:hypothetical protein